MSWAVYGCNNVCTSNSNRLVERVDLLGLHKEILYLCSSSTHTLQKSLVIEFLSRVGMSTVKIIFYASVSVYFDNFMNKMIEIVVEII